MTPTSSVAALRAALDDKPSEEPDVRTPTTTWAPVDLADALDGTNPQEAPRFLARSDGPCLLYPARIHDLHAEPEAGKGWIALAACAERLHALEHVLYVDFEDGPASIAGRLLALGLSADRIAAGFRYVRPDEPLAGRAAAEFDVLLAEQFALCILDGATESYALQGLDPSDNRAVAEWLELLPRRLSRVGTAVLLLDHVVKDREARGRWAMGAQHKLAGVDVSYSAKVLAPFGRGRDGLVQVKVEKDRPGHVREFADDHAVVADVRLISLPGGAVTVHLDPPTAGAPDEFRPTFLMERISLAVEAQPGMSTRDVRNVKGKGVALDQALRLLLAEDFIEARTEGPARRHYSLRPYREGDDLPPACPRVPAVSQPCPDTAVEHCVPVSLPLRGGPGTGHAPHGTAESPSVSVSLDPEDTA